MLPSEDHTKLVEQESTMEFLASIDAKIAVVAVIGPYRCKPTFSGLGWKSLKRGVDPGQARPVSVNPPIAGAVNRSCSISYWDSRAQRASA